MTYLTYNRIVKIDSGYTTGWHRWVSIRQPLSLSGCDFFASNPLEGWHPSHPTRHALLQNDLSE